MWPCHLPALTDGKNFTLERLEAHGSPGWIEQLPESSHTHPRIPTDTCSSTPADLEICARHKVKRINKKLILQNLFHYRKSQSVPQRILPRTTTSSDRGTLYTQ